MASPLARVDSSSTSTSERCWVLSRRSQCSTSTVVIAARARSPLLVNHPQTPCSRKCLYRHIGIMLGFLYGEHNLGNPN